MNSKAKLIMDMPSNCNKCNLLQVGEYCDTYCSAEQRPIYTLGQKERPGWCPLKEIFPESTRENASRLVAQGLGIETWAKINEIEMALGIELTPTQLIYIATGSLRRTGKTTANIIRCLVLEDEVLEMNLAGASDRYRIYAKELVEIKQRLEAKGVKTRPLICKNYSYTYSDIENYKSEGGKSEN